MVTEHFKRTTEYDIVLSENDPHPIEVINNPGKIILTGPHNGCAVPESMPECLGTDPDWFCTAHEAMDLYMDKLFKALQQELTGTSFISGNYSRLVCDLNAMPDYAFTQYSPEHAHIAIPQNDPEKCCSQKRLQRLETLYWPYHDAKQAMIEEKRQEHGGVIVLDMHSFTPVWQGQKREVEIGTIRAEKTPLSYIVEEFLRNQANFRFISGEPYRVAQRPSNAAPMITEKSNLQYLGMEIRNDLLGTDEKIAHMASFIKKTLDYLQAHPNFEQAMKPRNESIAPKPIETEVYDSWSI